MPQSSDSPRVEQLKLEAERSRAELAQTVHQLRGAVSGARADLGDRIAPETIKAEIGDFVRLRGARLWDAARQNPLQAAAFGAMAAYPAAALARRIPAPLMMIGAGLFLMSSETGRNLSQKAAERAGNLTEQGQRLAQDWTDASTDALASVAEQVSSVGDSIRSSVSETTESASRTAARIRSNIADGIDDLQRSSANAQERAGNASDLLQKSADVLANWARNNPMTAAAIGMAVGGLVASALPVTPVESRLAESASGDVRRRLGEAAAQGVTTATEAADRIAARTSQQGLTPEAIGEAARDYGERALKVAKAAADAALSSPTPHNDSQTPAGG